MFRRLKGDKQDADAQESKGDKQDSDVQSKGDKQSTDAQQPKGDKQGTEPPKGDKQSTDAQQPKGDKQVTEPSKGDKQSTDAQQPKGDKQGTEPAKGDKQGTEPAKGDKQGTEPAKGDKQGTEPAKGDKQGTEPAKGDKQGTELAKGDKQSTDAQQPKGDKRGTEQSKGDKQSTDAQQPKGDKKGTDVQQPTPAKDTGLLKQEEQTKDDELSREEKIKYVCSFLHQAPPGEFVDVFEDLRILLHDDSLMRNEAAQVCATHTKSNFTMVTIKGETSLVTRYNDLGGNRFFDPQNNLSFRFDHLSGRVDKLLFYSSIKRNDAELWRETLNVTLESYVNEQFISGECRVYRKTLRSGSFFVVCIESHQYEEFWNALWKSEWMVPFSPPSTEVMGNISLQIHYFEKANLHWTACKDIEDCIYLMDRDQFALDFEKIIKEEENKFHMDLVETLAGLSEELWRTIRRKLPVTRTVINWDKLVEIEDI